MVNQRRIAIYIDIIFCCVVLPLMLSIIPLEKMFANSKAFTVILLLGMTWLLAHFPLTDDFIMRLPDGEIPRVSAHRRQDPPGRSPVCQGCVQMPGPGWREITGRLLKFGNYVYHQGKSVMGEAHRF